MLLKVMVSGASSCSIGGIDIKLNDVQARCDTGQVCVALVVLCRPQERRPTKIVERTLKGRPISPMGEMKTDRCVEVNVG